MKNNIKEFHQQIENDQIGGEISDKEMLLKLSNWSTFPRLYMARDVPKNIDLYRRRVKINGMLIELHVFDVCNGEITLEALKHPEDVEFLSRK